MSTQRRTKRTASRWCGNRHGELRCQRPTDHDGTHRAETGEPQSVMVDGRPQLVAQVVSWD